MIRQKFEILSIFSSLARRCCSSSSQPPVDPTNARKISKAMQLYLENAKKYDEFLKQEKLNFEKGKRHLANMMGMDHNTMTQKDIDKAIRYLFPSGLYDEKARPLMKPPEVVHPPRKAAQFDYAGRPYHSMFYTIKPNFHKLIYDTVEEIEKVQNAEAQLAIQGVIPDEKDRFDPLGSKWISHTNLEKRLNEKLKIDQYRYFIDTLERLVNHPCSNYAKNFIVQQRNQLMSLSLDSQSLPIRKDTDGRPYVFVNNCVKKTTRGTVKLIANGTGKITINGHKGIDYFKDFQSREQVLFPFVFVDKVNEFDVEATVEKGGPTGHCGAIRWGIATGLKSFVDPETIESMRLAGLLTKDYRRRERKKPGQEGARRKFTWKKR